MLCRLFGHVPIPFRKHAQEIGAAAGIHLYGLYCSRCKREVQGKADRGSARK